MRNRKLKTNQENIVHTHFRYLGLKNEDDLKKTIISTWYKSLTRECRNHPVSNLKFRQPSH